MRLIKDSGEEMLQYQSVLMCQRVYFEPNETFERRLFGQGIDPNKLPFQEPAYVTKRMNQPIVDTVMEEDGLNFHSLNRVKKKINDYIINNYVALFFGGQILPEMIVTQAEILTCHKLLSKV